MMLKLILGHELTFKMKITRHLTKTTTSSQMNYRKREGGSNEKSVTKTKKSREFPVQLRVFTLKINLTEK